MSVKDVAICLRAVNYSDTSQVVSLLTREHGKIDAMAKGSRRAKSAFDGAIEVFSFGQVMFSQKQTGGRLAALTEFVQQGRFKKLSASLEVLHAALFAAELTDAFLEERDPHPALFDKFIKFLETMQDDAPAQSVRWLAVYQLRLLEEAGIVPEWGRCGNCGRPVGGPSVYFSSRNGVLCAGCEGGFVEKRRIDAGLLKLLEHPAALVRADDAAVRRIEELMIYHFTELLHRRPKMARYFLKQ